MEPLLILEDLMKEPDFLLTSINSIALNGSLTQQQQQISRRIITTQQSQPQQTQPQVSQTKTGAVEVLLKELNDFKKRVQQLEDQRPQPKTDHLELNLIRIPLTIQIVTTESSMTIPNQNGLGSDYKHIDNRKGKKKQYSLLRYTHTKSLFQDYQFIRKDTIVIVIML